MGKPVENTSGAPSTGITTSCFTRHVTSFGIRQAERRGRRPLDRWKTNHDHRLRVVERGRRIQPQVQARVLRKCNRRNVLVLRRMEPIQSDAQDPRSRPHRRCKRPPRRPPCRLAAVMKSELAPLVSSPAIVCPCPSSSSVWLPLWVRQLYCWSAGRLKQSSFGFRFSVLASRFECSGNPFGSAGGTCLISARYFSIGPAQIRPLPGPATRAQRCPAVHAPQTEAC